MKFSEATRVIYRTEGMKGFLRGLVPSLYKNFLTSGTYFSTLYYFETKLKNLQLLSDSQLHFMSSAMARTI